MAELRTAMERSGFEDVRTYIQSGNVIYRAERGLAAQARRLVDLIEERFGLSPAVAAFTARQWRTVVDEAPDWWGRDTAFRHNVLVLIGPTTVPDAIAAIGELRPELERIQGGRRVIYQSVSIEGYSRARTSRLPASPIYRQMTVRNHNTAAKLADLLRG